MVANIPFNPFLTNNADGSFNVQSLGYIQGQAMDDPSARYRLAGGVLADSETIPMWGGVAISEVTSPVTGGPSGGETGGLITRATKIPSTPPASGDLTGWSVFDQNYAAVNFPQSPVPLIGSKGQVNFYRLGSNARIAVACDPALVDLEGNIITQRTAWDWNNQLLIPYEAAAFTVNATGSSYVSGTGVVTLKLTATPNFSVGDSVAVASLTGTGADLATANGTYTVESVDTVANTITYTIATGLTITSITGGSVTVGGTAAAALPIRILNVNIGNSMTVSYDPVTGFATWNRSGSCALILI